VPEEHFSGRNLMAGSKNFIIGGEAGAAIFRVVW
jgi:hypothetical protein